MSGTRDPAAFVLNKLSEPVRDVGGTPSAAVLLSQASPELSSPYTYS